MTNTRIITYPQKANLTRRPRLLGRLFNHVEEALARPSRHSIQQAWRLSQASLICMDNGIAMSRPENRVRRLPSTVLALVFRIDFAERSFVESALTLVQNTNFRVFLPRGWVRCIWNVFPIWTICHQHWESHIAACQWTVNIASHRQIRISDWD
jgi:hypothetical protein